MGTVEDPVIIALAGQTLNALYCFVEGSLLSTSFFPFALNCWECKEAGHPAGINCHWHCKHRMELPTMNQEVLGSNFVFRMSTLGKLLALS